MAPRRVAAALADDDTLETSIREDILQSRGGEQPGDDQQDDADQGDDQQDNDGDADERIGDIPVEDQQDDADQGDQPQEPVRRVAPRQRREPDDRLSPAAEERIANAERIAADAVARSEALMQQFGQPRETAEQKAARHATMLPEAIIDEKVNEALRSVNRTVQQSTFNSQNSADKASFDSLVATNPALRKFGKEVERRHAEMITRHMRTGEGVPPREMVLKYMLGERAMELAQQAEPQRRARQQRVERQQVRAPAARGDVSTQRRRANSAEERLDGVQI